MTNEKNSGAANLYGGMKKTDKNHLAAKRKREREDLLDYMRNMKPGSYGPDYERRVAEVHREINKQVMKPEDVPTANWWKKTPEEKEALKKAKNKHNKMLRDAGLNPKKHMNLSIDELVKLEGFSK